MPANQVFISYSHADKAWLDRLLKHLKPVLRREPTAIWWDANIKAGQEWRGEIDQALGSAEVGVLLISANFLHSDFIANNELPYLLAAAKGREVKLLAVLLGNCLYDEAGLNEIQFVHSVSKPLDRCRGGNLNDVLVTICRAIRNEIDAGKLKQNLAQTLKRGEVTIETLMANPALGNLKQAIAATVESVLKEMLELQAATSSKKIEPDEYLEMAKGFTVAGDWESAAKHYDKYVEERPDDWKVHYLRAVAYANCRNGDKTNFASLRAYAEAIALAPKTIDPNLRARLHTYRGAIFKRLNRLDEALSDLLLAQRWAVADYEVSDNHYNLACVYALQKNKKGMLKHLRELFSAPRWRAGWVERIGDSPYFLGFKKDKDFQELLKPT